MQNGNFQYNYDLQLGEFGVQFNYRRQRKQLSYTVVIAFIVDVILIFQCRIIRRLNGDKSLRLTCLVSFWSLFCYTIFIVNVVFTANVVKERFESVNKFIK